MMRKPMRSVVTEDIYKIVKEQIMTHRLQPGDKINIDQWARDLEVSNIPIREALSRLVAEGMVTSIPYKGMYVTHMSLKELDEIFELRLSLELLALRKAFPLLEQAEVSSLVTKWQGIDLTDESGFEETLRMVARMNEDMHGLYLDRCGNDSLKQLVKLYIERIQRYLQVLHPDMQKDLLGTEHAEHLLVLAALADRNLGQAEEKLRDHLLHSQSRTRTYFVEKV